MPFAIRLDLDASRRTDQSGVLWGPMWFEVDGAAFPAEGWDDAVDPAFTGWLREAATLATTGGGMARLVYIDGPYEAIFSPVGDVVEMNGRVRGGAERSFTARIPRGEFISALAQAARVLARGFEARGWDADEWRRYQDLLGRAAPL